MSKFKTYKLEGSSQPGSFQTKRVLIKLCKLFKLNYGLEETDDKLLLTPLQGNYWNQNLHGVQMRRYIQESLSVEFFFLRAIYQKWKTFSKEGRGRRRRRGGRSQKNKRVARGVSPGSATASPYTSFVF